MVRVISTSDLGAAANDYYRASDGIAFDGVPKPTPAEAEDEATVEHEHEREPVNPLLFGEEL